MIIRGALGLAFLSWAGLGAERPAPASRPARSGSPGPPVGSNRPGNPHISTDIGNCSTLQQTFKLSPECGDDPSGLTVYPLLVTGTGGAGTYFSMRLLRVVLKLNVTHDNSDVGGFGAVAWPLAMRESRLRRIPIFLRSNLSPAFLTPNPGARFRIVVHQVRHPLSVIRNRSRKWLGWSDMASIMAPHTSFEFLLVLAPEPFQVYSLTL